MGCLKFCSRIFTVSLLIFKSFMHFEFILVYGVSWCSSLIFFFHIPFQFFPQHLLKGYFYSIVCSCSLCQISVDHRDTGLFLGSLFCSIGLCVCSYASTRLFWLPWPFRIVWYQVLYSSNLVLLSQDCWGNSGSFLVPYTFLKYLF